MNYEEKYKKYKNKYIKLRNQIGGVPEDELKKEINNCDKEATKKNPNHTDCPLCSFTNAGINNEEPNVCNAISGNVDKCFYNSSELSDKRINVSKYLDNKITFTVENNLNITLPDGEICFGNSITSCLTICLILNDNTKISAHINPSTNLLAFENDKIKKNEIVNIFNLCEKILNKLEKINQNIKKIILLSEGSLYLYKKDDLKFIGDSYIKIPLESKGYSVIEEGDNPIKDFLLNYFNSFIKDKIKYLEIPGTKINDGAIYIIKYDGKIYIYDKDDNDIDYLQDHIEEFNS